jgi:hypothetical protein
MRIGIDFDNTIVSYDKLFHRVAIEQGAVPVDTPPTKLAVRDYLRGIGKEDVWTEMQGYVYGARMEEADAYPGVLGFLAWARDAGIDVSVVSHKTRRPFIGPEYDLHEAARGWVQIHLIGEGQNMVRPDQVFFELTMEEKLARIARANCDWFIDDLPEILRADSFPADTGKILFDPDGHHSGSDVLTTIKSWEEMLRFFRMQ